MAKIQLSMVAIDILDRETTLALMQLSSIPDDELNELNPDLQFVDPEMPLEMRLCSLFYYLQPLLGASNDLGCTEMDMYVVEDMISIAQALLAMREQTTSILQDETPCVADVSCSQLSLSDEEIDGVERFLSILLQERFKHTNSIDDLDGAIHIRLKHTGDSQDNGVRQYNEHTLCCLLTDKYQTIPDLDTITEAIEHGRKSVHPISETTNQKEMDDPKLLRALAVALIYRANDYEFPGDIDNAIATMRAAIAAAEAQIWTREEIFVLRCNLVIALQQRLSLVKYPSDTLADTCVELCRQNLSVWPTNMSAHFHLAMSLYLKSWHTHSNGAARLSILAEAISVLENLEGGEFQMTAKQTESACANLLAECLRDRFNATGCIQDLVRSRDILQEVRTSPNSFPQEVERANKILSGVYSRLFVHTRQPDDLEAFLDYAGELTASTNRGLSATRDKIEAYSVAGSLAFHFGYYEDALSNYMNAVETLPHLLLFGRDRLADVLDKWDMLGAWAAAAGAQCGRPDLSVQSLELGRSIVWARALKMRTQLDELEVDYPNQAKQFRELSEVCERMELDQSPHVSSVDLSLNANHQTMLQESAWEKRLTFVHRWDTLVEEIQNLQGYSNFLRGPGYEDLKLVAEEGPVVLINICDLRSDAFILTTSTMDRPQIVSLSGGLDTLCREWSDTLIKGTRAMEDGSMTEAIFSKTVLSPLLNELWLQIMMPIRECLRAVAPYAHRVWFCPTGRLTFLPIHMVVDGPLRRDTFSQFLPMIPSYTITLSSLLRARSSHTVNAPMRLLAVSCSSVEGYTELTGTNRELKALRKLTSDKQTTILRDISATVPQVLEALPHHNWLHIACHGEQDYNDPYQSHFVLRDGFLQMSDFMSLHFDTIPEFACLSACQTATGVPDVSDEAMHLAASLHFAGFRGIVATMWSVDDRTARRVVEELYGILMKSRNSDGDATPIVEDAAGALWRSIQTLRKRGVPMSRLVPFVHIGM